MIVYFDTSALVPLLIEEATSVACGEMWDAADDIVTTRLAYIEAVAALAQAHRLGRIGRSAVAQARALLDELWTASSVLELDRALMSHAASLAVTHGLRGYDATHCAAAIAVDDTALVAVSGDARLLRAWRAEGLAVRDTTA
ncbi:type II toxin-antitoxin system VapC family toxin [Mumia quercus]|uniref:type II toxin-antitoxin system VapC family toxin n=1 Tax=Mumia quercus TaxID=2976125 RepID=UPI0021CEAC6A|nr:type II toxin-antitoxin system VapC family toxin [Mumia quercus]